MALLSGPAAPLDDWTAATRKLGATEEGTLRRYQLRQGGVARDSVMCSVLPEEWPGVKAGLLARLEIFAGT